MSRAAASKTVSHAHVLAARRSTDRDASVLTPKDVLGSDFALLGDALRRRPLGPELSGRILDYVCQLEKSPFRRA